MIKLVPGERVGPYTITRFLGRGGFALVYLATDTAGKLVALKIGDVAGGGRYVTRFRDISSERKPEAISPDEVAADALFFRFQGTRLDFLNAREIGEMIRAEGYLLRFIRDRNIVGFREMFEHDSYCVLALDYVPGKTLREKIRALEKIKLAWFLKIAQALQRLAKSGELPYHGDLRPENIIIRRSGSIVLIDPAMRLTEQKVICTAPLYNPFLLRDTKADLMGIGVMLYEFVTGVLPFDGVHWEHAGRELGGDIERLSRSLYLSYPPPRDLNPAVPEDLQRIIYHCLVVEEYGLRDFELELTSFLERNPRFDSRRRSILRRTKPKSPKT